MHLHIELIDDKLALCAEAPISRSTCSSEPSMSIFKRYAKEAIRAIRQQLTSTTVNDELVV